MIKCECNKEAQEIIESEIRANINLDCCYGKHKFIKVGDGSLDVKCVNCGIKDMRAVLKNEMK